VHIDDCNKNVDKGRHTDAADMPEDNTKYSFHIMN
jgi:hypothetical protein